MDRNEAVAYLESLQPSRVELGLDTMRAMLAEMGDFHEGLSVVHVGGTNGKGSTVAFLESILRAAGLRVGAYTSPHLLRYEERVRVDGAPIGGDALAAAVAAARPAIEAVGTEARPVTYFEAGTLTALKAFHDARVDVAILEVGLGGRLDATNVFEDPWCTIVTNVAMDHAEYLGDDVASVAREKAAIVKPGAPLVTGCEGDALDVVLEAAEARAAPAWVLGRDLEVAVEATSLEGTRFRVEGAERDYGALEAPLAGAHQARNAALAVKAAEVLEWEGHAAVPEAAVREGVAGVSWPGRLQLLRGKPPILLDGAHNPAACQTLAEFLKAQEVEPVVLFGALEDKDIPGMVASLITAIDDVVVTRPSGPRGAHPREAARAFSKSHRVATVVEDLGHALDTARAQAGEDGLVLVTGSLVLVGDVLELLRPRRRRSWLPWRR